MRSYWFGPSWKCEIRALATPPPPLTTNVPWKLRRLAASWMRSSQARTSFGGADGGAGPGLRQRRRHTRDRRAGEGERNERARQHAGGVRPSSQRGSASTVALRRKVEGTPSAEVPANCLCAAR